MQVGLSDHTKDQFASALALNLGCNTFEKHFTLSKKLKGPDHKASLNISELKAMIQNIRDTEVLLGKSEKKPSKTKDKKDDNKKSVVLIEYPRKGVWAVGFATKENKGEMAHELEVN